MSDSKLQSAQLQVVLPGTRASFRRRVIEAMRELVPAAGGFSFFGKEDGRAYADATRLHDLEINFVGINLSAPERVSYRYRLVGEDKEWQDVGKRRQAFYTRLSPGSYQFQVSASSGETNTP